MYQTKRTKLDSPEMKAFIQKTVNKFEKTFSEPNIKAFEKKVDDYNNETKKYTMTPPERLELAKQIQSQGINGHFVGLENGFRVNKGRTNYDIFYDRGKDTYVVYKLKNSADYMDFTIEKFEDVYWDNLSDIIK
jgi:hypothetical protein